MLPFRILKTALWKFYEDDGAFMARGLAFSLLIYCIPLSLLGVSVLSYTVASYQEALVWIRAIFQALMPQFTDEFSEYLSSILDRRGMLGIIGVVAFLFVSSTTFGSLRLVLNKIFNTREPLGLIHGKAMEIVLTIATSAMLFVMIGSVYAVTLVHGVFFSLSFMQTITATMAADFPSLSRFTQPGAVLISNVASFIVTVGLFWFIYRYSPARKLRTSSLLTGAVTATVLFEFSKFAFAWYLGSAAEATALYGTLTGAIFFFLWLYYACLVFVLGAEVAWACEQRQ